ncbi:MAG: SpoIID/LytB domain-containing protein [Bacteroides sp.]|nr:SpoIID/LytB domain-containing protein [Bacteroides sp.]MBD5377495.1 SpoIID/LytB domain-containing protein [Bacteroides sp.]
MQPLTQPIVKAGILTAPAISVVFHGDFTDSATDLTVSGPMTINSLGDAPDRTFTPLSPGSCSFELQGVTIGVNFHWERRENQRFSGALRIIPGLTAINEVAVEEYLKSVISSEMNSSAKPELLKAHAVISRSWLMAMLRRNRPGTPQSADPDDRIDTSEERIRWWDREDHTLFDVCADDHCQRYQGTTRLSARAVEAVEATRGQVLTSGGEICDARFSKCCGGAFEEFENCWAPVHHPYLEAARDAAVGAAPLPDLTVEENARQWILSSPEAFCNTADSQVLDQVLNSYDRETPDFYRWSVSYDADTLAELIRRRTGIDFGRIIDLKPAARGTSGRITRLIIRGTQRTLALGKELAIRQALSESHLYSSAFVVERLEPDAEGIPAGFVLHGAGWGHGVGLCQIGAAMMAEKGYDYRDILLHYYRGASIETLYQ